MPTLNERIGDIVKRKRQRDRLTQSDVGSRIGVSGSYISSIESAQTSPRIGEIEGLANVFRTTAIELINEAAQLDSYRVTSTNREREAFLALYDGLSPENQQQARTFLLFLRDQQNRVED